METNYQKCGQKTKSSVKERIYTTSIALRKDHPTWGADRISVTLRETFGQDAPSVRTLQRWYRVERLIEPKMRHNEPFIGQSRGAHNIWQVDAKEQLTLLDKTVACYLTFTDEYSGCWLGSIAFPYHRINQVPVSEVRQACITMFERWGKAGSFRVDNGEPLGNPKMNATTALALWLIGMDIDMIWNKPHCPQQNAKVERMQGTSARWVELSKCATLSILQTQLDAEAVIQREKLQIRRLQNQTRIAAYPDVLINKRPFNDKTFNIQRVYTFLATKTYVRKVATSGFVSLYSQEFKINRDHKGKMIEIKFNPKTVEWEFYDNHTLLCTHNAAHLTTESVQQLTVFHFRNIKI